MAAFGLTLSRRSPKLLASASAPEAEGALLLGLSSSSSPDSSSSDAPLQREEEDHKALLDPRADLCPVVVLGP